MNLNNHNAPIQIEKKIDAALKLLSETRPPAAMASRIHRSLETAMAASGQARRGRLFWVPATCAAVAAVLLVVFFQAHRMRGKQEPAVETAKMVSVDPVSPRLADSQPELAPERSREQRVSAPNVHRDARRRERSHYRHAVNLFSYPLTRQEKLLLQFAATAKPEDLRDLNPEYQAEVEARQEAEFAAYLKSGNSSNKQRAADINQSIQE